MDTEAGGFAEFVVVRERALQRTAWLLTGDWALAEDLVQTALARSWPRWERMRRRDNPEIYVRRVIINTWISWNRRRWRGEQPSAAREDRAAPGDLAAEVAVRIAVRAALASLTDRQRAVLVPACSTTCPKRRSRTSCIAQSGPSRARRPGRWPGFARIRGWRS